MAGESHQSGETFITTFEQWLLGDVSQRPDLETELAKVYRAAWSRDDEARFDVVHFVALAQQTDGYDLILSALNGPDDDLAEHAMTLLAWLALRGIFLGPASVRAVEELLERFPDLPVARELLALFDRRGWRQPNLDI